jgi:hypothetical protein
MIRKAAKGRVELYIKNARVFDILRLRWLLQVRHGFRRRGKRVSGFDEGISPDFVKDDLVLKAGYDTWVGFCLMANSEEGDRFLSKLMEELA